MKREKVGWLVIACLLFCIVSCDAAPKNDFISLLESQKDAGYGKVLPDSVVKIIIGARSIRCELQSKNPEDSLRVDVEKVLPKKMIPIVQYLFLGGDNFKSNRVVYSPFQSWVEFQFKGRRNKEIGLQIDFGSSRWQLLNKEGTVLCSGDLETSNRQFLNLTRMLFPDDETLRMLDVNLKAVGK